MLIQLASAKSPALTEADRTEMFRLRHRVFRERLDWEVASHDGMERDILDDANPVYMLVRDGARQVCGCWRLLPTTGPYMLRDIFPQLLHGAVAPVDDEIWELSRFAVTGSERGRFGFTATPVRMMQEVVAFAHRHRIRRYVTVTTLAVERMLRRLGLQCHRYGEPMQVGIERAVAFWIDMDAHTDAVLFNSELEARLAVAERLEPPVQIAA